MGFIPRIKCRRCEHSFSALRGKCPFCGARKPAQSVRTPSTTAQASARHGSEAAARVAANTRWQFTFGAILLAAVILAVIVLVTTSLDQDGAPGKATPTQPLENITQKPPPTPSPSPTPTEPPVSSITITWYGQPKDQFAANIGDVTPLRADVYPAGEGVTPTWSSDNESVCTVDSEGNVTGVGSGWATVTASAGGVEQTCKVFIR